MQRVYCIETEHTNHGIENSEIEAYLIDANLPAVSSEQNRQKRCYLNTYI